MIHLASLRSGKFQGNCTNAIALGKVRRMLLPSVLALILLCFWPATATSGQGAFAFHVAAGSCAKLCSPEALAPPPRSAGARQMFDPDTVACI